MDNREYSTRPQDLIFSSASINVDAVARRINTASTSQSISARLRSINQDAAYVSEVREQKQLPLAANERCGSWYIPPDLKAASAYFKSTDGHHGQWAFSLRRLNLHILNLIGEHGGCIIVDSTRRGKHAPDALAKTVPTWCAVVNNLLFSQTGNEFPVILHPQLTSDSESSQIASRLSTFVQQARELDLDIDSLRKQVRRPLKPAWLIRSLPQQGALPNNNAENPQTEYQTVYLCMASEHRASHDTYLYVQGAGDDSESWASGLQPETFWHNKGILLSSPESELPELIAHLKNGGLDKRMPITPQGHQLSCFPRLSISSLGFENIDRHTAVIYACSKSSLPTLEPAVKYPTIHLLCAEGKLGSRDLREQLKKLPPFVERLDNLCRICIVCPNGKDLSVGIALVLATLYANDTGRIEKLRRDRIIDKSTIKKYLAKIVDAYPQTSPSRATLNAVNFFLMS